MDELRPLLTQLAQQPLAFLGGFVSAALRLDLAQDPVKSWLQHQGAAIASSPGNPNGHSSNGHFEHGPQSISID